jgi:hypothetical protein
MLMQQAEALLFAIWTISCQLQTTPRKLCIQTWGVVSPVQVSPIQNGLNHKVDEDGTTLTLNRNRSVWCDQRDRIGDSRRIAISRETKIYEKLADDNYVSKHEVSWAQCKSVLFKMAWIIK